MKSPKAGSLLLLFLAWHSVALAQFGVEQPFFSEELSVSQFSLPQATNIFVDLDDDDLSISQISQWISRTNTTISFTNGASAGPLKESSGLHFYGTNWLNITNSITGTIFSSSNAFFIVFKNESASGITWKTLVGASGVERGVMLKSLDLTPFFVADVPISSDLAVNTWYDVVYLGGTNRGCFTNGVFSAAYTGSDAGPAWAWGGIGKNQPNAGTDRWTGYIRKVVWWTNSSGIGLSTNDAIMLHQWASTNKFSP